MASFLSVKVRYTAPAQRHLIAIADYIARENPRAAQRVRNDLLAAVTHLKSAPRSGRPGSISGTREWVVRGRPYIIVYRLETEAEMLTVLGVFHSAQGRL